MMQDDELDALMRTARRAYHAPPEPPLDAMWQEVERQTFDVPSLGAGGRRMLSFRFASLAAAAALVIGVGIGRLSSTLGKADAGHLVATSRDTTTRSSLPAPRSDA